MRRRSPSFPGHWYGASRGRPILALLTTILVAAFARATIADAQTFADPAHFSVVATYPLPTNITRPLGALRFSAYGLPRLRPGSVAGDQSTRSAMVWTDGGKSTVSVDLPIFSRTQAK